MISLLCPTRSRPQAALNLYNSFIKTQKFNNELIFCLQKGDDKIEQYISLFKSHNIASYFIVDSMPTCYLWNQMALHSKGDLLTLIGDDVEILTKDWDEKILHASNKFDDKIFVITVDDGRQDKKQGATMRCPHPTVHRKWVEALGYFVPPFFMHRYLDKYTSDLAIEIERFIELPDIVFNHLKFDYARDNTGKRSRKWLNYDEYVYKNIAKRYFDIDLALLKKKIDN
tara:strand:- start:10 stop:693 length:684 start_codon:yes stop_codon:yes gene_type:complete